MGELASLLSVLTKAQSLLPVIITFVVYRFYFPLSQKFNSNGLSMQVVFCINES